MSYSEDNSFEKILFRCLANDRLINVDRRPGSIIYDALAPVCMELADAYVKMDILESQSYLMSATGTSLEKRVYDYGLTRNQATYAQRVASFKKYKTDANGHYVLDGNGDRILEDMDVPIGMRFAVPNDSITYEYIGELGGHKVVECEQAGMKGNAHVGQILPLTPLAALVEAQITGTYKPAEDTETDEELRARAVQQINFVSFGGNVYDYIRKVNAIDGVGQTKVFPAWQFNGSVLLSVVDPQYNPVGSEFIANLKSQIDPEESTGEGVGIAPIGHYVTITTPERLTVDVGMTVTLANGVSVENVREAIEAKVGEYIDSCRRTFAQDTDIVIYRARIIDKVLEVPEVLNITNVSLNGEFEDITISDEPLVDGQSVPYMGSVTIE